MDDLYRICHWSKHFENHKSRGVESCRYVCMPNKQDGLGLTRILAEPDGATIFGVWCLILQACSRHHKRDGWLTDDGTPNGRPWDLDDLAFRWRRPSGEVQRCLAVVCSPKIAWMERLRSKCPTGGGERPPSALKEGKEGREGTASAAPDPNDLFEERPTTDLDPSSDIVALGLGTWINWRSKDPERERENVAEVAGLVAEYGPKVVQAAARAIVAREGRKAWPNEVLPEIMAGQTGSPAPKANPEDVRAAKAADLVQQHGWEACCRAADLLPESIRGAATMVEAMRDPGIFARVAEGLDP